MVECKGKQGNQRSGEHSFGANRPKGEPRARKVQLFVPIHWLLYRGGCHVLGENPEKIGVFLWFPSSTDQTNGTGAKNGGLHAFLGAWGLVPT